ncbi:pirin family protein [Angustibacter sp. McL0619]|uniref:pirin family protein n=1 Tax=Angustibacter sp. McL0619 TaxID=3415676 RepID=UPI003CF8AE20
MSNREVHPTETISVSDPPHAPVLELLDGREVPISKTNLVNRTLPHRERRMVGAWCFVDTYGPDAVITMPGMRVPPHPHLGLQTVSWLLDGAVDHRDSLGNHQLVQPGQLNLMTAGRGISHSEESPAERPPWLHGAQLWIALPEESRHVEPRFEHVEQLPVVQLGAVTATVLVGSLGGATSPARVHSPLLGADLEVVGPGIVPLDAGFEHAVVVLRGRIEVEGVAVEPGRLLYLGSARDQIELSSLDGGRCLLLGGAPFEEQILMWWNFVARTHDEIVAARQKWMGGLDGGSVFGRVEGFDGGPLPAPELPGVPLKPRGRVR